MSANSATDITFLGVAINTGSVGLTLVVVAVLTAHFTVVSVLKSARDLGNHQ